MAAAAGPHKKTDARRQKETDSPDEDDDDDRIGGAAERFDKCQEKMPNPNFPPKDISVAAACLPAIVIALMRTRPKNTWLSRTRGEEGVCHHRGHRRRRPRTRQMCLLLSCWAAAAKKEESSRCRRRRRRLRLEANQRLHRVRGRSVWVARVPYLNLHTFYMLEARKAWLWDCFYDIILSSSCPQT